LVVAVEARVHDDDDDTASHRRRRRRSKLRERERDGDKDLQTQQAMWQRKGYCARVQTKEGSWRRKIYMGNTIIVAFRLLLSLMLLLALEQNQTRV
jgi:hypothetical protein